MACVMSGLVENAEIDPADLCVNDAGMSSRVASWSEAGERLRPSTTSRSGKTCKAGTDSALRRVRPGISNHPWWFSRVPWILPHSAVCAAQDEMDETVVVEAVEDADMEAVTIMHGLWCFECCAKCAGVG